MGADVDSFSRKQGQWNGGVNLMNSNRIGTQTWGSSQKLILADRRSMSQALAVMTALLPVVPLCLDVSHFSTTIAATAHRPHEILPSLAVTSSWSIITPSWGGLSGVDCGGSIGLPPSAESLSFQHPLCPT